MERSETVGTLTKEQFQELSAPLPEWAIKDHPTKKVGKGLAMTVINPMAVIDRLNEVFGVGEWEFKAREIEWSKETQTVAVWENGRKTNKTKERIVFMSAVHGTLIVPKHQIHIEQFGGSTNDDMGDALKGGATDALTKCASYLGVGASIYKGQGNESSSFKGQVEEEKKDIVDW